MLRAKNPEAVADILAIHNNAGQIDEVVALLQQKADGKAHLKGRVGVYPCYTSLTASQLFETMPERASLQIPPKGIVPIRVVIVTNRARSQLNEAEFAPPLEPEPEIRRVVVSTNVAETSLTIHGILHVVDSGLINQPKWDLQTQTSAVPPILQSRAGCKQRWGRAGRLQPGDAWPLYAEAQFGREQGEDDSNPSRCFEFYSTPEIKRSPLEQVLLRAKQAGIESLDPDHFPWLDAPERAELDRARRSLEQKRALDPDGDLTEHGLEIGRMEGEVGLANLMVVADRFACAVEMASVLAVAKIKFSKLFRNNRDWDDQTKREVQGVHQSLLAGCRDDLEAVLKLLACWDAARDAATALVRLARWNSDWQDMVEALKQNVPDSAKPVLRRVALPADEARERLQPVTPRGRLDDSVALRLNLFIAPHLTGWHRLRQFWFRFCHRFASFQSVTTLAPLPGILDDLRCPLFRAFFVGAFLL